MDIQFEVYLRDHLKSTYFKEPIIQQYEQAVRSHYKEHKNHLLSLNESAKYLSESIKVFEKNNIGDYLIVNEAYQKLQKFSLKLPSKNQAVKDYINEIN